MASFVVLSALVAFAVALALFWPLRRQSPRAALLAIAVTVIVAGALYRLVGTPAGVDQPRAAVAAAGAPRSMDEAIARLEAEMASDPSRAEGWRLLAKSYAMQKRTQEASAAYARAVALQPDDADLLVEAAQARLFANPQKLIDKTSIDLLQRALVLRPDHQRARWFVGVAQRQGGEPGAAAATWEPLLAQVDAATAATLRVQIDSARAEAGLPALPPGVGAATAAAGDTLPPMHPGVMPDAPTTGAAANVGGLAVQVSIDPAFLAANPPPPGAQVFVIARMPGGPPMPVAVQRHPVGSVPLAITLTDADGPMPTQKLSALAEVEVVARISASGNAMRQPGDIESAPVRIKLPATAPVVLVIGGKP